MKNFRGGTEQTFFFGMYIVMKAYRNERQFNECGYSTSLIETK